MPTLKARQHTADHIFSTILENKYKAKSKAMQFESESVRMVWECKTDLREKKGECEKYVNEEIEKNREVKSYSLPYIEAAKIADLSLIPKSVSKPTIYEIVGLNKIACAGPHVSNTKEVGTFKILEIKRKGKDTYEIKYQVYDNMKTESKSDDRKIKLENPKGTRDYLPEEQILRNKIFATLKEVFELYGFNPLETPALECLSTLTSKYAGGAEITKQIFTLTDRGGRKLGLKYDQTVPMCRVLATNPQLPKPFKRYQMDRAWREEMGNQDREFWQCDVDIVGPESMMSDAEYLAIYQEVFKRFDIPIIIKINNRKLLNGVLDFAGVPESQRYGAILSLDKLGKIDRDGVIDDAREREIDEDSIVKALDLLEFKGTNSQILKQVKKYVSSEEGKQGIKEMEDLLKYAKAFGVKDVKFIPSLARGLEYYTGPVFEVFWKKRLDKLSLAGGGRYDKLIGSFVGSKEVIPATGTTIGLSRIYDLLSKQKEKIKTVAQVFVISIGDTKKEAIELASALRESGIKTDIDFMNKSLSKNLDYANKQGIPYVTIIGKQELAKKKVKLRDMVSGKEQLLTIQQIVNKIKQT